jgi:hypothetical protein
MKENKFLGNLLPSSPDLQPIIEVIREKYNLAPISPDDDPITEIYLEDRPVTLVEFRQGVDEIVRKDLRFLSPSAIKQYEGSKLLIQPQSLDWLNALPDENKAATEAFLTLAANLSLPILQGYENFIDDVADMIYFYILTGEAGEVPSTWSSRVVTVSTNDEPAIIAMANQIADPEEVIKLFRQEYRKTFGTYRPRITDKIVSTAYYVMLKRQKNSWAHIVEEFIRLEKIKLPRNKSSKGYTDRMRIIQQKLKKRIQRSEIIFDVMIRDKK